MDVEPRVSDHPSFHLLVLVRDVVVHHEVHIEVVRDVLLDDVQELDELGSSMPTEALTEWFPVATSSAAKRDVVP